VGQKVISRPSADSFAEGKKNARKQHKIFCHCAEMGVELLYPEKCAQSRLFNFFVYLVSLNRGGKTFPDNTEQKVPIM
jgi:hypothetical protein